MSANYEADDLIQVECKKKKQSIKLLILYYKNETQRRLYVEATASVRA